MSRSSSLLKGIGPLINEISLESIIANPNISIAHENLVTLTSYNLLEKQKRTIIVPGSPPRWALKTLPVNLKPDSGRSFLDPAGHVFPTSPLEPLFRALFITRPDFDVKAVDLVTDRRNLRLLLDFVHGGNDEFRINVEVAGNTVLFSRWSKRPVLYVNSFAGYGHEFEKAFTKYPKAVKGSISHNRAISYTLGGVKIIMRFQVDGYKEGTAASPASTAQERSKNPPRPAVGGNNTLSTPTGFSVLMRGKLVAPSSIIEVKTGSAGKNMTSKAKMQMWLSQTPILLAGSYSQPGVFDSVQEINMIESGKFADWEKDNAERLRKLVKIIEMICGVVKNGQGSKFVIAHIKGSKVLKVYTSPSRDYGLPADILAAWND